MGQDTSYLQYFQQFVGKKLDAGAPPFSRWLDGILLHIEQDALQMQFRVHEQMLNPIGLMHGGVHAAIIDELTGLLVAMQPLDTWFVTVNLSVDYFGKVRAGELVTGEARLVKTGRTIIHAECILKNEQGETVSRGTCNLANTHKPKATQL